MAQPLNCTFLTGEVSGPCELRTSKAGKAYASFKFMSKREVAGKVEETELNCMAFGGLAERIASYLRAPLFIAGRLRTERWEYQGKPYSKLVLNVDDARPLIAEDVSPVPIADAPAEAPAVATEQPPF